jgi:hypothetical protein
MLKKNLIAVKIIRWLYKKPNKTRFLIETYRLFVLCEDGST